MLHVGNLYVKFEPSVTFCSWVAERQVYRQEIFRDWIVRPTTVSDFNSLCTVLNITHRDTVQTYCNLWLKWRKIICDCYVLRTLAASGINELLLDWNCRLMDLANWKNGASIAYQICLVQEICLWTPHAKLADMSESVYVTTTKSTGVDLKLFTTCFFCLIFQCCWYSWPHPCTHTHASWTSRPTLQL